MKRDYSIDNTKAFLIFLVILAHLFEFNVTSKIYFLLLIIYSFHMPVFIYYSGYLAKYDKKKLIKNIVIPYLFIQILSYVIYNFIGDSTNFYLVSAYTSLWYMISLFFWYLSIPFAEKVKHPKILILLLFILGLIIGYDTSAGTVLSVSRTIVFAPIFYIGYFSKKLNWFKNINTKRIKFIVSLLVIIIIGILFIFRNQFNVEWFYSSKSYAYLEYNPLVRGIIYLIAIIWILFFKLFSPNKKCIITKIGKNSLSIYLLHYIIVYYISVKTNLLYIGKYPILNCLVLAILITIVLSSDWLNNIFKGKIKFDLFVKKQNLNNRGV